MSKRVAMIRTSDRGAYKSCRRKWGFSSHLKRNLEPKMGQMPLWFGTGIHYALEDHFDPLSTTPFSKPSEAFMGYVKATELSGRQMLPPDYADEAEKGVAMLDYLIDFWLPGRDPYKTFVYEGVSQLEINFQIPIPLDIKALYPDSPYDEAVYTGTMDRVIIDENNVVWIVDYKTAKTMKASHFDNDPQVSAYCWAASELYPGYDIGGLIYWQLLKAVPAPPKPLKSGKISCAKNLKTSRPMYRRALIDAFGPKEEGRWPAENVNYLNSLAATEGVDHDAYVRRDKIYKNPHSIAAEGAKILAEVKDMLDPAQAMYPNATFMCPHMCPFYNVCLSMDDGSDWEMQLEAETQSRASSDESWRAHLPRAIEKMYGKTETFDFDNPLG